MTTAEASGEPQFEPPGPGFWEQDSVHFPRPVTRYWTEIHPEPFARGTAEFAAYYGMLIDGLRCEYVNGFAYKTVQPAPEEEIPQRFARAEEVFARKLWREQLREWDETFKPAAIAKHRELQSVDSRRALRRRAGRVPRTVPRPPRGDDLPAHALHRVRGRPDRRLPRARRRLDGAAPVRAARPDARRVAGVGGRVGRARAADRGDRAAIRARRSCSTSDGDPGRDARVSCAPLDGEAGAAVSAYLDLVGYRLLDGFDISEPYALELPDALLRAIRIGGRGAAAATSTSRRRSPRSARRCPRSTAPSSTSCSARRG